MAAAWQRCLAHIIDKPNYKWNFTHSHNKITDAIFLEYHIALQIISAHTLNMIHNFECSKMYY